MPYQTISATDAAKLIEKGGLEILDVRSLDEFKEGHIKDAVNINLRDPSFMEKISSLDKEKTYLVYCLSGMRSKQAVTIMDTEGFTSLYTIAGGLNSWKSVNLPVVK